MVCHRRRPRDARRAHGADLERRRPRAVPRPAHPGRRRHGRARRRSAIESYGPLVRSEERRERRERTGLDPSRSPSRRHARWSCRSQAPLFQDPGSRIVVLTNSEREPPAVPAQLTVERIPGDDARPRRRPGAPSRAATACARCWSRAARRCSASCRRGRRAGRAVPDAGAEARRRSGRDRRSSRERLPRAARPRSSQSVLKEEGFLFLRYRTRAGRPASPRAAARAARARRSG